MALIHCPECAKEVSNTAVACPNCGHPLSPPAIERETIVREAPPVIEKEGFPNWVFIPLAVLGIVVIFLLIMMFSNKDETDRTNVNITTDRTADLPETTRKSTPTTEVVVPSDPTGGDVDLPPSTTTTVPSTGGGTTTVPPETATVGTVNLELRTRDKSGKVQPAKNEIFYLLDKDFDSILREANVTPIAGQSLANSFGLSIVFPDRYDDFRKKALNAIEKHIKYDVKTDTSGKANISKVKPDSYYFFAVHKIGNEFALWTQPITINNGENNLNMQPQSTVEVKE